jgi:hypothetical protein
VGVLSRGLAASRRVAYDLDRWARLTERDERGNGTDHQCSYPRSSRRASALARRVKVETPSRFAGMFGLRQLEQEAISLPGSCLSASFPICLIWTKASSTTRLGQALACKVASAFFLVEHSQNLAFSLPLWYNGSLLEHVF